MNKSYVVTALVAGVLLIVFTEFGSGQVRVYDCGMAEWHPDIPNQVRDECRKLRYEHWKDEQEKEKQKRIITT